MFIVSILAGLFLMFVGFIESDITVTIIGGVYVISGSILISGESKK